MNKFVTEQVSRATGGNGHMDRTSCPAILGCLVKWDICWSWWSLWHVQTLLLPPRAEGAVTCRGLETFVLSRKCVNKSVI